jgi:uncharacterized protein (DUF2235 family)
MRNLVVLSDGTGNSAGALNKTNVWRLYEALDLSGPDQIATFGDGVGTSKSKWLRPLGLAFGIGVKKNTLQLYKFLCRNYGDDDRIWCFGFSRGAFTVRTLAGLIQHEGLVSFRSEEELDRAALAAYRAYRKMAFPTYLPWVFVGRWLRDTAVWLWNKAVGQRTYREIKDETLTRRRSIIPIEFLGVWDTVVAYGLPVDELTQAVDKWVWPMTFRDRSLLINVKYARHALSIDDDRRTFFPVPWDEAEARAAKVENPDLPVDRLLQVWFAGVHANVGGGYPDDSLSYVPLCWMIEQAAQKGLVFRSEIVAIQAGLASAAGRQYDCRAGFGMFYRYQPRDVAALMGEDVRPIIHHSVVTRMALGAEGYAPISLPDKLDVMAPYGRLIPFNGKAAANQLRNTPKGKVGLPAAPVAPRVMPPATTQELQESKKEILQQIVQLDTTRAARNRASLVELVRDTVWWRRLIYFVTLGLAVVIVAFPLISPSVHFRGDEEGDSWVRTVVQFVLDPFRQFLPGYATPWVSAVEDHGSLAAAVLISFGAMLALSQFLRRRISDRSRAAWRVQARVDGNELDRLRLTGQSRAALSGAIGFAIIAALAYAGKADNLLVIASAIAAVACLVLFIRRKFVDAGSIDAAHPGFLLSVARWLRTQDIVLAIYRWFARIALPAFFLFVCIVGVVAGSHHLALALLSNGGQFCEDSPPKLQRADEADRNFTFKANELCQKSGVSVTEGQRYRITVEIPPDSDWFDRSIWTDVRGFPADRFTHYVGVLIRRWWTKNWFQPVVRVGRRDNFEYALEPVEPLPDVPLQDCAGPEEKNPDYSQPASPEIREAVKQCGGQNLLPSRKLVAEFTPRKSGELFVYVNDAVLLWPGMVKYFYGNNSGSAQVTVAPVLAPAVISR